MIYNDQETVFPLRVCQGKLPPGHNGKIFTPVLTFLVFMVISVRNKDILQRLVISVAASKPVSRKLKPTKKFWTGRCDTVLFEGANDNPFHYTPLYFILVYLNHCTGLKHVLNCAFLYHRKVFKHARLSSCYYSLFQAFRWWGAVRSKKEREKIKAREGER